MVTASSEPGRDPRRDLGARGERLAADHLEALGLEVIDRNFRTRLGEIDLVARDRRFLVFCEVKTRLLRGGAAASRRAARGWPGAAGTLWVLCPRSVRASAVRSGPWPARG